MQIERQLDLYMRRVEDVLGKRWANFQEGQRLQKESENFRPKLNPQKLYDAWLRSIKVGLALAGIKVHRIARVW